MISKCTHCGAVDIAIRHREELVRSGNDVVIIPMDVETCEHCGEVFYTPDQIRRLEAARSGRVAGYAEAEPVGTTFAVKA